MTRHRSVGLSSLILVLMVGAVAQAVAIQDLTTGQYLFYDNFESSTPVSTVPAIDTSGNYRPNHAVLGSWITNIDVATNFVSTQVTNSTAAPDPGPFQGTQYLRLYRDSTYQGGAAIAVNAAPDTTIGDVVKMRTMVYLPSGTDVNARSQIYLVGSTSNTSAAFLTSPAWVRGDGAGNVDAVVGDGNGGSLAVIPTGLTYATNTWQEWDLTYTIGSSTFSVTVNGVTASGFSSVQTGGVAGLEFSNGSNTPGSAYFDSVPGITILPGDLNQDGQVNLTDYGILTSHWLQTGVSASNGDLNGDGTVNISDFAIFKQDYIAANGAGSGLSAVPEPAALCLAAFALPALYLLRRRKATQESKANAS